MKVIVEDFNFSCFRDQTLMYFCLNSELDRNEMPLRSSTKKACRRPRRRCRFHHHISKGENLLLKSLTKELLEYRPIFERQKVEIQRVKDDIEKYRVLTKRIDDGIETLVDGICAIQEHIQDFDENRRLSKF